MAENQRFLWMKISSKYIFTQYSIMISTNSTDRVAKIQLLGTKIHYTTF